MKLFDLSLKIKGFPISKAVNELKNIQNKEKVFFLEHQKFKRTEILKYHLKNNPAYADFCSNHDCKIWEEVPVLTKNAIQKTLNDRLSKGYSIKNVHVHNTSGSSGQPFYFAKDKYCHAMTWPASVMLSRLFIIKYIHILHGGSLPDRLNRSKWFCDKIFLHSYANVAVSGYLKYYFEKAGYQATTIPNNIDIGQYTFKRRTSIKPLLLWVRSFHIIYNSTMAADVLAMLLKDYPNAELCMVGPDKDGSMQVFKNYCVQLGISNHVKVTGLLSKPEWHVLSADYDIFINTTNVDNTPVSVIEAMALGLPVVSTNVGGVPFLLENGKDALLVEKADAEGMYQAIKSLIEDKTMATTMAAQARKKAESFDWEVVKEHWGELLK